jgi:predicted ester cyclase
MSLSNAALFKRWLEEAWNYGHQDASEEMLSNDIRVFGLTEDPISGNDECIRYWKLCHRAFSDIEVVLNETVSEGNRVAGRFTATALHSGDAFGLSPTGYQVNICGALFTEWEDGQIVQAHGFLDLDGLHRQIDE